MNTQHVACVTTHQLNPIESMRKFRIHRLYSNVYIPFCCNERSLNLKCKYFARAGCKMVGGGGGMEE